MAFSKITLTSKGVTITGELVLESSTHWQVAVDGRVGVYGKDTWHQSRPDYTSLLGDLSDLLGGFR